MAEAASVPFPHTGWERSRRSLTSDVHYEVVLTTRLMTSLIPRVRSFARRAACALVVGCAGAATACGGSGNREDRMPTPTAPSAPSVPTANFQFEGDGRLTDCIRTSTGARCDFVETAKNAGPGCATRVRISVRLVAGESDVAVQSTALGSQIFRPDEPFSYRIRFTGSPEMFASVTTYRHSVDFSNTPC
jgi:hypothetical protein